MRELVVEVTRTVGVRWPDGWRVGIGDRLVLVDGRVARVEEQPTEPGKVYGDLLNLLMDGAISPVSHPPAELEAELRAAVGVPGGRFWPQTPRSRRGPRSTAVRVLPLPVVPPDSA